MTSTLLLRLQGPMQAWGVQSLFSVRDTTREPTWSGVVGLLCCALGRHRGESLDDFASLRMGVRVDSEGIMMKDFHVAQQVLKATGGVSKNPVISDRYYLSDAVFLVGIESDDEPLLTQLQSALRHPKWLLYLGRRAFPPTKPVWLKNGIRRDESLEFALKHFPYLMDEKKLEKAGKLRVVLEDGNGSIVQQDMPISFQTREFVQRIQTVQYIDKPQFILEEVCDVSQSADLKY